MGVRERYREAVRVFHIASSAPPDARESVIREHAGGDERVVVEVAAMLAHSEQPLNDLRTPAPSPTGLDPDSGRGASLADEIPARVGRYAINGRIGWGGSSVVYEAVRDGSVEPVALKMIAAPVTPDLLRRCEREARVQGKLRHPGIAVLHDAGVVSHGVARVPYFELELVRGRPFDRYVQDRCGDAVQKIELLLRVLDAVGHAHQHGVIHRDLKPSNILVTDEGQPKILDFGIARSLGDTTGVGGAHTIEGQVLGTLAYMSPEQAAGKNQDIGAWSDVYAIGVLAHEAFVGTLPVRGDERAVRLAPTLGPGLGAVLRRALSREPADRYQSAVQMADDLRRVVRGAPVLAARAKRRHRDPVSTAGSGVKAAAAAAACMAALAAAGVIGSQLDRGVTPVLSFASGDARLALASARAAYDNGDVAGAERLLRRTLSSQDTEGEYTPEERTDSLLYLARASARLGNLDEAERLASRHVEESVLAYGPDHPKTTASRVRAAAVYAEMGMHGTVDRIVSEMRIDLSSHARVTELFYQELCAVRLRARALRALGRESEAIALFERVRDAAFSARSSSAQGGAVVCDVDRLRAQCEVGLAGIYWSRGEYVVAEGMFREAVALARRLKEACPEHGTHQVEALMSALGGLGVTLRDQGRFDESLCVLEERCALAEKHFPHHPSAAHARATLATLYYFMGRYEAAADSSRRSLAFYTRNHTPGDHAADSALVYGLSLAETDGWDDAEAHLAEAHRLSVKTRGDGHWKTTVSRLALIECAARHGRSRAMERGAAGSAVEPAALESLPAPWRRAVERWAVSRH